MIAVRESLVVRAKTLGALVGIAVLIGVAVALVDNLLLDDTSFNAPLVGGAIAGLVVVAIMRPVARHFEHRDRN